MTDQILPPNIVRLAKGNPIDTSFRINLHFHPDVPFENTTVIENIARTKRYHSQFVTGISNGRVIESSTDDRILWEQQLFDSLYDRAESNMERPKYGAVNFLRDPYGSASRFGSCYFRLKEHCLSRTTFCFPESSFGPRAFGTAEKFDLVGLAKSMKMEDPLDWYIEAHVHGPINLPEDVEALVLDPSYQGTYVENAACQLECDVEWHSGYETTVTVLRQHSDYRGNWIVDVANKLADDDGRLNPAILGMERRNSSYTKQEVKKVWHCLARFGRRSPWPNDVIEDNI